MNDQLNENDLVFFCASGIRERNFDGEVFQTIQALRLKPYTFFGPGSLAAQGSINRELKSYFNDAEVIIVFLSYGNIPNQDLSAEDNWALPLLKQANLRGVTVFIYHTPSSIKTNLGNFAQYTTSVSCVKDEKELILKIREDLGCLLANPARLS